MKITLTMNNIKGLVFNYRKISYRQDYSSRRNNYRNLCTVVMYNMAASRLQVHLEVAEYGGVTDWIIAPRFVTRSPFVVG